MVERVRVKADQSQSSVEELSSIFPTFCWILRDFFLEEKVDDRDVSPKEYMEHCLKLKVSLTLRCLMKNMATRSNSDVAQNAE